jgi:hypothetical protein
MQTYHFTSILHNIQKVFVQYITEVSIQTEIKRCQLQEEQFKVVEIFDGVIIDKIHFECYELHILILLSLEYNGIVLPDKLIVYLDFVNA